MPSQQATLALLWLEGDAAIWWQTVRAAYPVGTLQWGALKSLLQAQFRPVDAARRARDRWAACTQGKGSIRAYMDSFRRCLLSVTDADPAEVLDRFLRGLAVEVRKQVLVQQPAGFAAAALVAERLGSAMGEAPRGIAAGPPSHVPMELGQAQGHHQPAYTPRGGFSSRWGGRGGSAGHRGLAGGGRTCHYCGQPGHFMLSCPKLKRDMAARKVGRGRANQAAAEGLEEPAELPNQGNPTEQ